MKEVGTLNELGVGVGDVVECVINSVGECYEGKKPHTIKGDDLSAYTEDGFYYTYYSDAVFRIISRATPKPKIWSDMTPEEKGALLLAAHDGKVIEAHCDKKGWVTIYPSWDSDLPYRIKPEPKVETVTLNGDGGSYWGIGVNDHDTHRITFQTLDCIPDPTTIKMEAI